MTGRRTESTGDWTDFTLTCPVLVIAWTRTEVAMTTTGIRPRRARTTTAAVSRPRQLATISLAPATFLRVGSRRLAAWRRDLSRLMTSRRRTSVRASTGRLSRRRASCRSRAAARARRDHPAPCTAVPARRLASRSASSSISRLYLNDLTSLLPLNPVRRLLRKRVYPNTMYMRSSPASQSTAKKQ